MSQTSIYESTPAIPQRCIYCVCCMFPTDVFSEIFQFRFPSETKDHGADSEEGSDHESPGQIVEEKSFDPNTKDEKSCKSLRRRSFSMGVLQTNPILTTTPSKLIRNISKNEEAVVFKEMNQMLKTVGVKLERQISGKDSELSSPFNSPRLLSPNLSRRPSIKAQTISSSGYPEIKVNSVDESDDNNNEYLPNDRDNSGLASVNGDFHLRRLQQACQDQLLQSPIDGIESMADENDENENLEKKSDIKSPNQFPDLSLSSFSHIKPPLHSSDPSTTSTSATSSTKTSTSSSMKSGKEKKEKKRVQISVAYSEVLQLQGNAEEAVAVMEALLNSIFKVGRTGSIESSALGTLSSSNASTRSPSTDEAELNPLSHERIITALNNGTPETKEAILSETTDSETVPNSTNEMSISINDTNNPFKPKEALETVSSKEKCRIYNSHLALCYRRLGVLYKVLGRLQEAEQSLKNFIAIIQEEKSFLPESPRADSEKRKDVGNAYTLLATIIDQIGNRTEEASEADRHALELLSS